MFDGSALPLTENLDIAAKLLERFQRSDLILEIEAGVVGGEEDGVQASASARLYTTPEDTLEVARRLNRVPGARYLLAATFGNVHGVYKPGHVKLKPSILKDCQDAVALDRGVAKTNVDTDMEYAFTRAVANHMFKNYDGVQGGRRGWQQEGLRSALLPGAGTAMAERVKQAVAELRATGTTLA
jgi:fructose-bisphosphate aldolase class II